MRISGIWRYHVSTSWRSLAMLTAIVLVIFVSILFLTAPYMAETMVNRVSIGTSEVVVTHSEADKLTLTAPFGTSAVIYFIFMLVYSITSVTADRRYLLSNNVTRYEFIIGTFLSAATMAVALTGIRYVLDLVCRIVTYIMGFQIRGMVWSPALIFASTKDYLPTLVGDVGNMIAIAGGFALMVLLFTRWKKICISLCVLAILLPIMMVNFLPANWIQLLMENAETVYNWIVEFFNNNQWLFLTNVSCWRVLLQQTVCGAAMYAISYLVIRHLPVRIK